MLRAFRENGLEHILDCVPNHMGVGGADNPFWLDVLEWGRDSEYASWFDIDWDSHSEYLSGKLLVPFLADQYGAVLESGKIELKFDANKGEFSVWLYDVHRLPVSPSSYPRILSGRPLGLQRLADEFAALRTFGPGLRNRGADLKAQLAHLVATNDQVRAALEEALGHFRGTPGQLASWTRLDSLIRENRFRHPRRSGRRLVAARCAWLPTNLDGRQG